jgi:NADH-quinone oxidoreductase subunit K
MPLTHYLVLSAILFAIGLLGLFLRKNLLLILLSIEILLNSANLSFIAASAYWQEMAGQVFAFFSMTVAAAEVTVGLALAMLLFRRTDSVCTSEIESLKG